MKTLSTDLPLNEDDSFQCESDILKQNIHKKKKKRLNSSKFKTGRWDVNEHKQFIELFLKYKKNWKKIESFMSKRTAEQIRSHSQKYVIKLIKKHSIKKTKDGKIFFSKNKIISEQEKTFVEYFFQQNNIPKIFKIEKFHTNHIEGICPRKKTVFKKFIVIPKVAPSIKAPKKLFKTRIIEKIKKLPIKVEEKPQKIESISYEKIIEELKLCRDTNNTIINTISSTNFEPSKDIFQSLLKQNTNLIFGNQNHSSNYVSFKEIMEFQSICFVIEKTYVDYKSYFNSLHQNNAPYLYQKN